MNIFRKIKYLKSDIKYWFQRGKQGYCNEDLYSIDAWFIRIFPKMLDNFFERTIGVPMCKEELIKDVANMPKMFVEDKRYIITKKFEGYAEQFDTNDTYTCWLLIILRMKKCFELCDEWNSYYEIFDYEEKSKEIEKYKKEAFYLLEKYFYNLWW